MRGTKMTAYELAPDSPEDFALTRRGHLRALPAPSRGTVYLGVVKPLFDRVVGTLLLLLALPVMVVVGLAVWARLGSPVLIRQARVGQHGAAFGMLKFRTMHPCRRRDPDLPPAGGADRRVTHKSPDDPRLIPLGRILRKVSLDELPQLWHVVRGQMSLVGPRPELAQVVRRYEPWQHGRHVLKPGLTGLWQVTERSNGTLMHEHVEVDLDYITQVSLRTDLRILARTARLALGGGQGH